MVSMQQLMRRPNSVSAAGDGAATAAGQAEPQSAADAGAEAAGGSGAKRRWRSGSTDAAVGPTARGGGVSGSSRAAARGGGGARGSPWAAATGAPVGSTPRQRKADAARRSRAAEEAEVDRALNADANMATDMADSGDEAAGQEMRAEFAAPPRRQRSGRGGGGRHAEPGFGSPDSGVTAGSESAGGSPPSTGSGVPLAGAAAVDPPLSACPATPQPDPSNQRLLEVCALQMHSPHERMCACSCHGVWVGRSHASAPSAA